MVLEEDRGTHRFDVVHPRAEVFDCFKSTEVSVRRPGKELARMHCVGNFSWSTEVHSHAPVELEQLRQDGALHDGQVCYHSTGLLVPDVGEEQRVRCLHVRIVAG